MILSERPILFSGPMVRALLAGAKTQTRRAMKAQPSERAGLYADRYNHSTQWGFWLPDGRMLRPETFACPYGDVGARLWVRETWCSAYGRGAWGTIFAADDAFVQGKRQHEKGPHFNADDRPPLRWRPSIFMPRWASRIALEVTEVRVQRVQDISEEDARAEGTEHLFCGVPKYSHPGCCGHRPAFRKLWDSINGKRPGCTWADNPWLWCVSFRRVQP